LSTGLLTPLSFAQGSNALPVSVSAPTSGESGNIYTPEYFSQYAPVTAADMVQQLPNFVLSMVESKRGLGQGGVNVLINGVRLSGKNNDAISALSRIPATSVVRLEILDGTSLNIPGLAGNVVNIVTRQKTFSGSWKYRAEVQKRSRANLFGFEGSVSGTSGPFEYNIGLTSEPFRDTEIGTEVIVDAQGNIIETRSELGFVFEDNPKVSSEITYAPGNGQIGHLNASYQKFNIRTADRSSQTAVAGTGINGQRLTNGGEDEWKAEIGGDYSFDFGSGNLKLIALTRHEKSRLSDNFTTVSETGNRQNSIFEQDIRQGETILRAEYSIADGQHNDWQLSLEGAFNDLESDAVLFETNPAGNLIEVAFPNSSTRVEESRVESNLTHNRKLSDQLNIQASVGVEVSELKQTSPSGLTRDFVRPKGFISASYEASDSLTVRGKVERTVDQLDFFTFISSVDLADDLADAGNPQIVPAQSWDGEIEFVNEWNSDLSSTLKIYGKHVDDLVDRIPLPGGVEAPGNIETANVVGVELTGTALLDKLGIEGGRIDFELEARETSVDDPLSAIERRFSNHLVSRYQFDFRHDIPGTDLAWGGFVENTRNSARYRINQVSHFTRGQPDVQLYIEHKNFMGLTVRADVRNLLSSDFNFRRNLWDGENRAIGAFRGYEERLRNASPQYGLTISGTF
jgi:hypothetical protein